MKSNLFLWSCTMKQTNIHLFTTRTNGRYKGLLEGTAQWLESLERYYTMKTLSDTPKTFTFTTTLPNFEQAQRAGSALIGYMIGTYDQSSIDITYIGNGSLKAEYTSDKDLTENFERITNSLDHTDDYEDYEDDEPKTFRLSYHDMRVSQLQELDKDTLINDIIAYELELLDHADRLLSDKSSLLDSQHGYETIELLGDEVIDLVKKLDTNKELDGIRGYIYW